MGRAETLLILFAFVIVSSFAWSSSPGFTVRTKGDWILHPAKLCKGSAHGVSSLHLAGASLLSSSKGRRAASLPLAEVRDLAREKTVRESHLSGLSLFCRVTPRTQVVY